MKTNKDQIIDVAVRLFAERGFDAVSTSMIAAELGITKGALYRHFQNKQEIYDSIIEKMFKLDEQRANEDAVPAKSYEENPESYQETELTDFCQFAVNQLKFWTEDTFASNFRKMIMLEQFKSEENQKLYQDVIAMGPVRYSEDMFRELLEAGKMNEAARQYGAFNLAMELFAPLSLMIQLSDGGADKEMLTRQLSEIVKEFERRWT